MPSDAASQIKGSFPNDLVDPKDKLKKVHPQTSNPLAYEASYNQTLGSLTDAIQKEVHQTATAPVKQLYLNSANSEAPTTLQELRTRFLVDLSKPQAPQPVAVEILSSETTAPIISYGAITLITAQAKSGKTFAQTLLVSALVSGQTLMQYIRPVPHPDASRTKIVVFDTEMSAYHVQLMGKRIERLTGKIAPANLEVWKLRTEPNDVKKAIIQQVIEQDPTISAVIIDGVRDTIFDINNPEEAVRCVASLLQWCELYQVALVGILHQNKGDKNARGHIGTEMKNKAEVVVNVERDKQTGLFSIEPEATRDREFEPIVFRIDETGAPVIIEDRTVSKENEPSSKKKLQPHQVPDATHLVILQQVFSKANRPKWSDLVSHMKNAFNEMGCELGISKTEDFVNHQIGKGWITKNSTRLKGERFDTYGLSSNNLSG